MRCLICSTETEPYFSKTYTEPPFDRFMADIGPVHYHRCGECGFVQSRTHAQLPAERWARLNSDFHHFLENPESEKRGNQPPYAEQALMLRLLGNHGIIDLGSMIDHAAGYGTLSRLLERYFNIHLPLYDPYVQGADPARYIPTDRLGRYRTVINSAMFEHVLRREDLDDVHRLVDDGGCLMLHTVICERVPKDPDWFYLRPPVHTAFHTNRSMGILMEQWGYRASIYSPKAKSWILLKQPQPDLGTRIKALNWELQSEWFLHKAGFVDYWKGF